MLKYIVWEQITVKKGKAVQRQTYWRRRGERMYSSYSFTTSALDGGVSGQRHATVVFYPRGKNPCTHWKGGWVGLRAGLDTEARGKNPLASAAYRTSIARSSSP
jgi:hypothetical protein